MLDIVFYSVVFQENVILVTLLPYSALLIPWRLFFSKNSILPYLYLSYLVTLFLMV